MNNLNVFPVPDGDTGTNMLLTLQSAVEDIRESPASDVGKVARIAAHGSLMGARGNSGVILSQIFRGFANAAQGRAALAPEELGDAFEEAANAAYRAVNKPTEGTILTVAREAGRAALDAGRASGSTRVEVMRAAARAAQAAVERTPTQLRILREAGVVDAGGYGLQLMLEGMLESFREGAEVAVPQPARHAAAQTVLDLPEEGWGYCTEFLLHGRDLDQDRLREEITAQGNSVLVVGDEELIKVHVHTEDPTAVIGLAAKHGRLDRLNVGDMSSQHRRIREEAGGEPGAPASEPPAKDRSRRKPGPEKGKRSTGRTRSTGGGAQDARPTGVAATLSRPRRDNGIGLVAVVAGEGLTEIFRGLGVDEIVTGGQSMNPSTQDMLHAVEAVDYPEILLLPNNKNVVLAAGQVRDLTQKRLTVVETLTMPQGIAALIAFNPTLEREANLEAMQEATGRIQTIEVTHAVRDTRSNGKSVKKGDVIALVNDRLEHAGDDYTTVVQEALGALQPDRYELVTIYRGDDVSEDDATTLSSAIHTSYPTLEVDLQAGGQHHYPFILSLE